jgi:hypothetical protein
MLSRVTEGIFDPAFVANGGGWSEDGRTPPGRGHRVQPYGAEYYGLSRATMVWWITS